MPIWDRFTYEEDQSSGICSVLSLCASLFSLSLVLCVALSRFYFLTFFLLYPICVVESVKSRNPKMTSSSGLLHIFAKLALSFGLLTLIQFPSVSTTEVELRRLLFPERKTYDSKVCPEPGITKVHTNLILLQIESVNEKQQVCADEILLNDRSQWNLIRVDRYKQYSIDLRLVWSLHVLEHESIQYHRSIRRIEQSVDTGRCFGQFSWREIFEKSRALCSHSSTWW